MFPLRWLMFPLLIVLAASTAACGSQGGGDASPSAPNSSGGPTGGSSGAAVNITRTGGIAGVDESVEITATGQWTYTNRRTNTTQTGSLTAAQSAQLVALVGAPAFIEQLRATPAASNCADGFNYTVTAGDARATFVDCGGDTQPAVRAVITAVTDATPL